MRRVMFVLLLLLLPLRGWVGDAMAMQMALAGPDTAVHHAAPQGHPDHAAAAAEPCSGHGGAVEANTADDSHCGTCAMCQTCHTLAVLYPATDLQTEQGHASAPRQSAPHFRSADRIPVLKPPIS